MSSVYVLGLNAYHGDVSAVLLRDGAVVAALEEERFTRIRHTAGVPTERVRRCVPVRRGHLAYPASLQNPTEPFA